ncbi:unnamed protein product [Rhizophagus irregularis]|nr:unnamed protein product [Rhizophagus irregularis]CAB4407094.1 unnamed protein product [Rhizophagus irregularis]
MEKLIETIDDVEKTCDFSCAYNSQTSSMNYHLNTTHKVYEKKKADQLKIDGEFKKVTPYKEPKQKELNEVNGNGLEE